MGTTHEARDILRKAFPGIPLREAEEMVSIAEVQSYGTGVVLCQENRVENVFYIILEGQVQVTKTINDAEDRLLKVLMPGDFFGEMGLIHNAPRAATVTTEKPTRVLTIYKQEFEKILQISPSVSMAMVKEVSRRLRENDEMAIEDLRLKAGELAIAYQRLAQEDFARREFLTTIAHELRTPLTAARGFLDMARASGGDQADLSMALDTVGRNLQQIISLVNDILFLQEVELVLPETHPQDMGDVARAALDAVGKQALEKRIHLQVDIAPDLPFVLGHFNSLKKALTKVLDNAIKFSPDGGVVNIFVEREAAKVRVRIADEGVGIPVDALDHIFGRFYHLDEVEGELFGGLGLGLSITRQVIDQHGGQISVESVVGKGSTFSILLDAIPGPPQE